MIHYIIGVFYGSTVVRYYKYMRAFDDVPPQDEKKLSFYFLNKLEVSSNMTVNLSL